MRLGTFGLLGLLLLTSLVAAAGCSCEGDTDEPDAATDGDSDTDSDSDTETETETETETDTETDPTPEEQAGSEVHDAVTEIAGAGIGQGLFGLIDSMVDALDTAEDNTLGLATCPSVNRADEAWKLSYGSTECVCDPNDPDTWLATSRPCQTRSGVLAGGPVLLDRGQVRDDFDWRITFGGEEVADCGCINPESQQMEIEQDVSLELAHRRGRTLGAPRYEGSFLLDRGGQGEWTARDSAVTVDVQNQHYAIELLPSLSIDADLNGTATVTGGAALGETYALNIDADDPLVFDRGDDCACPSDGTLTISNATAGRDIIVDYRFETQDHCGADVVRLRTDNGGPCDKDDPADFCDVNLGADQTPDWLPSDLGSIDGLCLQGQYACPRDTRPNCDDINGVYQVGQGDLRFSLEDDAGPLTDPITGDYVAGLQPGMPGRLCHEAVLGQLDGLSNRSWRFEIHDNCQVDIAEGRPDRNGAELRWMPRTACARLDRQSNTLMNADLGGNVGALMFGANPQDVTLTVGDGELSLNLVFPVDGRLADECRAEIDDANACLHGWTIPVGCVLQIEDLLDPGTTADDFELGACRDAKERISECSDGTLREFAAKIAAYDDGGGDFGCITIDGNGRLDIDIAVGCLGVRNHLASLLADPRSDKAQDHPFVSILEYLPLISTEGLKQRIVVEARQAADCTNNQCLPDPGGDDVYSAGVGDLPGRDSQVSIELERGQRVHFVTIGQATLDLPDMEDLEETCRRMDTVCHDQALLAQYLDVVDFTSTCDAMAHLCEVLGSGDANGLLDEWLAGIAPDDWGFDAAGGDPTGLHLDEIRQALDEWDGNLDNYSDRTLSFAHVFVADMGETLEGTQATINDSLELVPAATLAEDTLAEISNRHLYEALPFFEEGNLSEGAVLLGANSITDGDGHFEYDADRATYEVTIDAPNRPNVVLAVPVVQPVEVCHPTGWMLDNFYSPAIQWNGAYTDFIGNLPEDGFPSIDDINTFKKALWAAAGDAPDWVTIHMGSYAPLEEGFPGNPSYNPLNQHLALWRVVPDIGLFTMAQPTWAKVAPTDRDYMHSPQPLLDYVLNIAMIRAERRMFTANDLYGRPYDLEWSNDIAIVKTVTIDFKVNFVFNTDLIADENSYFFRRDVLGAMIDLCESPDGD